ncbi:hypothetical protein H8S90_24065 [Olivibacter sp. SDN3]|uniref:hypothetical protein n=1 Tax=Olivibacter sp. SDN3 TaxID=2764720 RepID=UPI001650EFFA|nr:hypothetical protein [Olivibacter sp. SDN3]QNL49747.1 hypothetical protein H8S90_24065 [Olivibacter sp. SDN3]
MKLKEIRDEKGTLSGVLIPADDIMELKESLKTGSKFFDYFDSLQSDRDNEKRKLDQLMLNKLTVAETDEKAAKLTTEIHREAFSKGVPMFYRDERAKAPKEFIRANPDGSEDLVRYDIATRSYSVLRSLLPAGKGYWSKLSIAK